MARVHRGARVERWLFNALHSLDFSFWYSTRPLWDIGIIEFCLGGLTSSGIGLWLGIKRLLQMSRRFRSSGELKSSSTETR